jgi:hypothetical protein
MVMIPAHVTLNLNGKSLTAGNLLSFGNVIDKKQDEDNPDTYIDGKGGIKISNDKAQAFTQLQKNNTYLPIYDTANGCYRFFGYNFSVLKYVADNNSVQFKFRLRLTTEEAYKLLADTANNGVEISVQLNVSGRENAINYVLSGNILKNYADEAYAQVSSGEKLASEMNKFLGLTFTGLDKMEAGTILTVTPSVSSVTGFRYEKLVDESIADAYTKYTIPTTISEVIE